MAMVKASLTLSDGDTLVVRRSERYHIHLMSAKTPGDSHADILSVQDQDSAYLTVPYSDTWSVLIDSHSQSLEHPISYIPAWQLLSEHTPGRAGREIHDKPHAITVLADCTGKITGKIDLLIIG